MNVSYSSSTHAADGTSTAGNPRQIRADMQALDQALQANDPQGAQNAFFSLLQTQRQQGAVPFYSADGTTGLAGSDGGYLVDTSA